MPHPLNNKPRREAFAKAWALQLDATTFAPPSPQAVTPAINSVWAAVSNGHPPLSHAQLLVTVADFGRRSGSGYKAAKRVAEIAAIRHEDW